MASKTFRLYARLCKGDFRRGDHEVSETFQVEITIPIPDDNWETVILALPGEISTRALTLGIPRQE